VTDGVNTWLLLLQVMAREIFNPNLALFVSVPEGGTTFQPNPNSIVQNDTGVSHLEFFKFVGRVVGKALYDGQLMDAYFTRSFYKHMLGEPLTYEVRRDGREGMERGDKFVGVW
jgi:E3 ubiquitin-protein ligase HUWE1